MSRGACRASIAASAGCPRGSRPRAARFRRSQTCHRRDAERRARHARRASIAGLERKARALDSTRARDGASAPARPPRRCACLAEAPHPWWRSPRRGPQASSRSRPGVPHRTRTRHEPRHPAHVTLRAAVASRRRSGRRRVFSGGARCPRDGRRATTFRHGRVLRPAGPPAPDRGGGLGEAAHVRGLQGVAIRVAKGGEPRARPRGRGVGGPLPPARRIVEPARRASTRLVYVLQNWRKHVPGGSRARSRARRLRGSPGWRAADACSRRRRSPVAVARTWLARRGWRRHGLIDVHEAPARGG